MCYMEIADILFPLPMQRDAKFNNCVDSTPHSFPPKGSHPFSAPCIQPGLTQTYPVLFSRNRGERWGEPPSLPERAGPATRLPALRATLQDGRGRQQMTPCCSAAHLHSQTPGCSCSATSGPAAGPWCWVGRQTGTLFSQETQAPPSHTPQLC